MKWFLQFVWFLVCMWGGAAAFVYLHISWPWGVPAYITGVGLYVFGMGFIATWRMK